MLRGFAVRVFWGPSSLRALGNLAEGVLSYFVGWTCSGESSGVEGFSGVSLGCSFGFRCLGLGRWDVQCFFGAFSAKGLP